MDVASTMMDVPLTVGQLVRYGQRVHHRSRVVTWSPDARREATFAEVGAGAERLAAALTRLGVGRADRVATLAWNHQEHLEAYFGVPGMGAVLHTLNLRLSPEQLAFIVNDGGDRVILVDASLIGLLAAVAPQLSTVEHVVVLGTPEDAERARAQLEPLHVVGTYAELITAEEPGFGWAELDERSPAAMCYTSGTTGNPKGVVYSHRSTVLHSMNVNTADAMGFTQRDRLLLIVPMFHANAWGNPYAGWLAGSDFVLPQQYLQAEHLARMIADERPTFAAGVPTIWNDLLNYVPDQQLDLSSLRMVVAGGAALSRGLLTRFNERFGVAITQGWGMTETSPLAALSHPPRDSAPDDEFEYRLRTGRLVPGVDLRIVDDDGNELPWDGATPGEIQVRGPWITGSYHGDPSPEKFDRGWLRTGDVGTVDDLGYIQLTDRTKDVIKSGGEWISSVQLENAIMTAPGVVEAAVIGIPDDRWTERPLACVVLAPDVAPDPQALRDAISAGIPRWWLPENWSFIDAVPKTSVGKFDKKLLRIQHAKGDLPIVYHDEPAQR